MNAKLKGKKSTTEANYAVETQVGHLLRRAHQRHCAIFTDNIGEAITPVQFAALTMVGQQGEVSQNHLGRLIATDPATIQGVVGRLAERKLIKSKPDPDDRRRQLWYLTAKGKNLVALLVPNAQSISEQTLAPLSEREKLSFMKLLAKIS